MGCYYNDLATGLSLHLQAVVDDLACILVDAGSRLIGLDHLWSIGQCPRHTHALLLASAQLPRLMPHSSTQPQLDEQQTSSLLSLLSGHEMAKIHGDADVLESTEGGQ